MCIDEFYEPYVASITLSLFSEEVLNDSSKIDRANTVEVSKLRPSHHKYYVLVSTVQLKNIIEVNVCFILNVTPKTCH